MGFVILHVADDGTISVWGDAGGRPWTQVMAAETAAYIEEQSGGTATATPIQVFVP